MLERFTSLSRVSIEGFFSTEEILSIQANRPVPMYHQLYVILKNRILAKSIKFGTILPGEVDISNAVGVSRITANKAVSLLARDDLVERQQGVGSFVTYDRPKLNGEMATVSNGLFEGPKTSTTTVVIMEDRQVSGPFAKRYFGSAESRCVLYLSRVQASEERLPFAFHESWTCGVGKNVRTEDFENQARLEVLKRVGLTMNHAMQSLSAAPPCESAAKLLGLPETDRVLRLQRCSYDQTGAVIDLLISHFHPDRYQFSITLGPMTIADNTIDD